MNNYTSLIDKIVDVIKNANITNLGTNVFDTDEIVFNSYPVVTVSPLSFTTEHKTLRDDEISTVLAIRVWGKIEQDKSDVERTTEIIGEAIQTLLIQKVTLDHTLIRTEPMSGNVQYPERFGEPVFMYEIRYTGVITQPRY